MKNLIIFAIFNFLIFNCFAQTEVTTEVKNDTLIITKTKTEVQTQILTLDEVVTERVEITKVIDKFNNRLDQLDEYEKNLAPTLQGTFNQATAEARKRNLKYFIWAGDKQLKLVE
jgi:mevalonate kinase